jgi:outer membrane protein OmpA-like peptidoglycan-associated protein
VFFAFGKTAITTEGARSLGIVAEYLKANPTAKIQIKGFCNTLENEVGVENDIYADMDNQRIGAIMEYLKELGIDETRMIPTRKRDTTPNAAEHLSTDDDEMIQAKNRRVEFDVM